MSYTQLSFPAGKAEYNWNEAASLLGISADELQSLVVERLGDSEVRARSLGRMRFSPADLIMLNMVQISMAPIGGASPEAVR